MIFIIIKIQNYIDVVFEIIKWKVRKMMLVYLFSRKRYLNIRETLLFASLSFSLFSLRLLASLNQVTQVRIPAGCHTSWGKSEELLEWVATSRGVTRKLWSKLLIRWWYKKSLIMSCYPKKKKKNCDLITQAKLIYLIYLITSSRNPCVVSYLF